MWIEIVRPARENIGELVRARHDRHDSKKNLQRESNLPDGLMLGRPGIRDCGLSRCHDLILMVEWMVPLWLSCTFDAKCCAPVTSKPCMPPSPLAHPSTAQRPRTAIRGVKGISRIREML